jgi:hypothetical protein
MGGGGDVLGDFVRSGDAELLRRNRRSRAAAADSAPSPAAAVQRRIAAVIAIVPTKPAMPPISSRLPISIVPAKRCRQSMSRLSGVKPGRKIAPDR